MEFSLENYPKVRSALYFAQWAVNLVMGVIGIIIAVVNGGVDNVPVWYVAANLVFNFVWTYTGTVAKRNLRQ